MAPRESAKSKPKILDMPSQKMAVVSGKGAPGEVFSNLMPALYGTAYTLKFERKKNGLPTFKVSKCRSRYLNAHIAPMEDWSIHIGLPIPEDTISLTQKVPDIEVKIETWEYGTVAQTMHLGPYDQVEPAIKHLQQFIEESDYEISGVYEEEYLTRPDAKVPKTLIRYPVKKKNS